MKIEYVSLNWQSKTLYLASLDHHIVFLGNRALFEKYLIQSKDYQVVKGEVASFVGNCRDELKKFLSGDRTRHQWETEFQDYFQPKLIFGTPFQQKVWQSISVIPWGQTLTYSDLAQKVQTINHTRALANAIAKNPLIIFIPCHRVLPRTGGIGKYSGGTALKAYLLTMEKDDSYEKIC